MSSPAGVSAALEEQFPASFGGLVVTSEHSVDIYTTSDDQSIVMAAQRLLGDSYQVAHRPAAHTMQATRLLKQKIERDMPQLAAAGIRFESVGIHIASDGPRAMIAGLDPDTAEHRSALNERYGETRLEVLAGGPVIFDVGTGG